MTKNNSVNRWRFVVGVGIAAAIVGWFVVGLGREAPEAERRADRFRKRSPNSILLPGVDKVLESKND